MPARASWLRSWLHTRLLVLNFFSAPHRFFRDFPRARSLTESHTIPAKMEKFLLKEAESRTPEFGQEHLGVLTSVSVIRPRCNSVLVFDRLTQESCTKRSIRYIKTGLYS